ncbi:hypothetical protein GCM10028777_16180 [Angustibacter speluncae]
MTTAPGADTRSSAHAFDSLHGTWAVHHAVRRGRLDGVHDWDTYDGRAVCAPILDGAGQLDQIWLPHRGVIGSTLRLYDRVTDTWRLHWSTSDAARLDPPLEGRFVDGVGTFTGTDELDGRAIDVRFVWDRIGPTRARWTQSFAWSGSGEWEPNWTMDFDRISSDATSATTGRLDLTR